MSVDFNSSDIAIEFATKFLQFSETSPRVCLFFAMFIGFMSRFDGAGVLLKKNFHFRS